MRICIRKRLSELTGEETTLLLERRPSDQPTLRATVAEILERVRAEGDNALRAMALEFDGAEISELEIPRARWDDALETMDPAIRSDLERAVRNIERFHRAQIPQDLEVEVEPGVVLGRRVVPLARVGVYAPGGRAAYPSSVLMGVVPARAAGVREIVVCSPPGPSGEPPAGVLAACAIAGASRLFALGGAGAIGALTFGTETVPRVDAVVGPGNRYVNEAKRQVSGDLRIDSPAGPSEVLVIASPETDPERCAAELIAQAEHDPDAAVALVTWDAGLLKSVSSALERRVDSAARREVIEESLATQGALLLSDSREEALAFGDAYAPEHLALFTDNPRDDLHRIATAGTAFLGEASSVAQGDYLTGANHVLPTGGAARSFSGLSAHDFLRAFTYQEITPEGAASMRDTVVRLAEFEGLPGHADSVRKRP